MIRTRGLTTELRIEAAVEKRPPSKPYNRSTEQRRIIEGRCKLCGKARRHYTQRCDACQNRERIRWNKAYGNNFGWFAKRSASTPLDGRPLLHPRVHGGRGRSA